MKYISSRDGKVDFVTIPSPNLASVSLLTFFVHISFRVNRHLPFFRFHCIEFHLAVAKLSTIPIHLGTMNFC